MDKKGQTTLFIILGVVIVIIIGLYALVGYGIINKRFIYSQQINNKQNDIDEYVKECIKSVIKEKLKTVGLENIDFNSLADDPEIKNCFNLNQVKENFEIVTANAPNIDVSYVKDDLEFGVIYPVTISKGNVNATLTEFNFTQELKTCGIDYYSVDERVRIRSNEESCITLVGVTNNVAEINADSISVIKDTDLANNIVTSSGTSNIVVTNNELLTPVYRIDTIQGIGTTLIFGNPKENTKEITIVKQINENEFNSLESEITEVNENINTVVRTLNNKARLIKHNKIVKSIIGSGNFSLGLCSRYGCPFYNTQIPTSSISNIPGLCEGVICSSGKECKNGVCVEEESQSQEGDGSGGPE